MQIACSESEPVGDSLNPQDWWERPETRTSNFQDLLDWETRRVVDVYEQRIFSVPTSWWFWVNWWWAHNLWDSDDYSYAITFL